MGVVIEVAPIVHARLAELGQRGAEWLAELPDVVAGLERRWSMTVDEVLPGGSTALVARVRISDDRDGVVKLAIPDSGASEEAQVLMRAHGRGYVKLLDHDPDSGALLLEPLGPSLDCLGSSPEFQIERLCATLRQAWRVPPETTPSAVDLKATALAEYVEQMWERLEQPCSERVVAQALGCARRRVADHVPARCVLVHGDPHSANALQVPVSRAGGESGFVFVDPDGFVADPTYDLGVVLRDWCEELTNGRPVALAEDYCGRLADQTGLDETAIWEWGFLERVSTGLCLLQYGAHGDGRAFLDTAEMLA
ncbi:aminoglycoside phosphotransferase family protein [Stackebrandtia endophytica]